MIWRVEARNIIKYLRRNEISNLRLYVFIVITGIAEQVLLLDDVATRGHSLNAGRLKLKEAGALLVAAIALGHTQF